MSSHVVRCFQDRFLERPSYLRLEGAFKYPSWTSSLADAHRFTAGEAARLADSERRADLSDDHPGQPRALKVAEAERYSPFRESAEKPAVQVLHARTVEVMVEGEVVYRRGIPEAGGTR